MSGLYYKGETKYRAGIYRRHEKVNTVASAMKGVFCIPVHANFGPLGEVVTVTTKSELSEVFTLDGTVDAAAKLFDMGANTVHIWRLGADGKKGSLEINNTDGTKVVTLETKYETSIQFSISLRQKLGDETTKECYIYKDATLLEKLSFAAGENEIDNFISIMKDSNYFIAEKDSNASGILETINQKIVTGGADVTINNESYGDAFAAFEGYDWNVMLLDSTNNDVKTIAKSYMDRIHDDGSLGVCVLGESTSASLQTRINNAKSYNAPYIIYCGSGYIDTSGNEIDGYLSVAAQAGLIGCKDSSTSIVHAEIPDAEYCIEKLTEVQYIEAIKSGLLLLSEGSDGQVWFDSGVNTYTVLAEEDDEGWMKIKRTAVRYEAFDRINRTLENLIGKINCDSDGIDNVIQQAKKVLEAMVQERKILDTYEFYEDTENPHDADHAHFIIRIDDIDSLEKIYLTYQFQYSSN